MKESVVDNQTQKIKQGFGTFFFYADSCFVPNMYISFNMAFNEFHENRYRTV